MVRVVAALACGHVDWVSCDKAHLTGAEALPETLWCGHCGSWQPLIEFVSGIDELALAAREQAPRRRGASPGDATGLGSGFVDFSREARGPLPMREARRARSMREELTTDLYHLNRIRRHEWDTTIMAMLKHGPRRPGDVVAAAVGWRFHDPWEGCIRELAESRVRESLSTLVKHGLAQRQLTHRAGRDVEYELTSAGKEYVAVMQRECEWLARHRHVLDNAVRVFREDRRSRIAGRRYRASRARGPRPD